VIREKTQATLRCAKQTGTAAHTVLPVTAQFAEEEREAFYRSLFPARRSAFKSGDSLPHHNPEWQLQDLLGSGGFGEVWAARHAFLGEQWAVKFCQDADSAKILRREAQTLYTLRQTLPKHPHIVALKDLQLKHEPYWLAFEYVPGGTLESLIRVAPMSFEQALELLLPVIEAMAQVHAAGMIHRDLKPANLLIGADGGLKIADFGIGKVTAEQDAGQRRLTQMTCFTTQGYGSVGYMSPEQAEGQAAYPSDDVFSLAVILWQMCAGSLKPLRYPNQLQQVEMPEAAQEALMAAVFCGRGERPKDATVFGSTGFRPRVESQLIPASSKKSEKMSKIASTTPQDNAVSTEDENTQVEPRDQRKNSIYQENNKSFATPQMPVLLKIWSLILISIGTISSLFALILVAVILKTKTRFAHPTGLSVYLLPLPHCICGGFAVDIPTHGLLSTYFAPFSLARLLLPVTFTTKKYFISIWFV